MTREEALEWFKDRKKMNLDDKCQQAEDMAIKAIEQEPVLDKIRTEIETKYGQCDICEYFENYDYEENDISEYRPIGNITDILQIIDKHRVESEGNNDTNSTADL